MASPPERARSKGIVSYMLNPSATLLMCAFIFANFLNFMDRGIIPGAPQEFEAFVQGADELRGTSDTNLWYGMLQSAFIVGYSVSSLIYGNLVHRVAPLMLVAYGLGTWCLAAFIAGAAEPMNSYFVLLLGRMLSGAGEASFQVVATPFIQDNAGERAGLWLALFFTAIPFGTAAGYVYGALFANSEASWRWAFWTEVIVVLPLSFYFFLVRDAIRSGEKMSAASEDGTSGPDAAGLGPWERDPFYAEPPALGAEGADSAASDVKKRAPSFRDECNIICRNVLFWMVSLGYAAYTATVVGFSTFGTSFVLGLRFFESEKSASLTFGGLVAFAGVLGTPVGGWLLDHAKKNWRRDSYSLESLALSQAWLLVFVGMLWTMLAPFVDAKGGFMAVLWFGIAFYMMPTAAMNVSILESVPPGNRPLAVGMSTLIMHAFGDVLSPLVVGAVKDALAPNCTPNDDGDIPEECDAERGGLKATMWFLSSWVLWSLLCFGGAFLYSRRVDNLDAGAWRRGAAASLSGADRSQLASFRVAADDDGALSVGSDAGDADLDLEEDPAEALRSPLLH